MSYSIDAGIQLSLDGSTWYALTDHNRQPITLSPTRIEQQQRMANGRMRKFVVANKQVIDCSWQFIPAASKIITSQSGLNVKSFAPTVDGKFGAAFMKAFYEQNLFVPIYVKLTYSTDNATGTNFQSAQVGGTQTFQMFMTDFKYTITKRYTLTDYVDVSMQFTEI
jgi:hypothetical protein